MDGHRDREHSRGNAVSINTLASKGSGRKAAIGTSFHELYRYLTNILYT